MKNFIIGMFIGAGAILPGISSGVFCVIFGLYEKLVDSVLHFFKDIKKNFLFLCPIVLGAFLSIFLFSNILLACFNDFYVYTCYAFIGLILGSIPAVFKQSGVSKPNFYHVICLIFTLVFSIYLVLIEKGNIQNISSFSNTYLILVGALMSAGIVIPGVSKTAILIMMGVYSSYLSAISTLNFNFLVPMGIGLALGSVVFMYAINFLFSHFKSYTYFLILGFVIGSCFVIFPGFDFNLEHLIAISISFICYYFVKKIDKIC